ncbi:MAG: hypothetical protein QW035_01885 [Candidatus Anstonellales archaeon]
MAADKILIALLLFSTISALRIDYYATAENLTAYVFSEPLEAELLVSDSPYCEKFYIYRPQRSVGLSSFQSFLEKASYSERLGIQIEQTSVLEHPGGTVILPTGAVPENLSNTTSYILIGIPSMCFNSSAIEICEPPKLLYSTGTLPDDTSSSAIDKVLLYEPWHTSKIYNISGKIISTKPHSHSRIILKSPFAKAYTLSPPNIQGLFISAHPNQSINILSVQNSREALVTIFSNSQPKTSAHPTDNGLLRYSVSFEEPGDYAIIIKGNKEEFRIVHIYNLSIAQEKDELRITLDGSEYNGPATLFFANGSNSTTTVSGGRLRTTPALAAVSIMGQVYEVKQSSSPPFQYIAVLLAILFFLGVVFLAKPYKPSFYTIRFHEKVAISRQPLKVSPKSIIKAFELANSKRGWSKVALYPEEIAEQVAESYSQRQVIEAANIESVLLKMEKHGVQHHNHIYSLRQWGDAKTLASKREIRDILVLKGIKFKETKEGFRTPKGLITTSTNPDTFPSIIVFDSAREKREALSGANIPPKKLAKFLLMEKSGSLQFFTKKELRERL